MIQLLEWGGGSSPVETEPPQIVVLLLLLLFRTGAFNNAFMSTSSEAKLCNASPRRLTAVIEG